MRTSESVWCGIASERRVRSCLAAECEARSPEGEAEVLKTGTNTNKSQCAPGTHMSKRNQVKHHFIWPLQSLIWHVHQKYFRCKKPRAGLFCFRGDNLVGPSSSATSGGWGGGSSGLVEKRDSQLPSSTSQRHNTQSKVAPGTSDIKGHRCAQA